jgi:hypothetical protein
MVWLDDFPYEKKVWFLALALNILFLCLSIVTLSRIPPRIPLFYSLPWGEEQLAPKISLPGLLAASLISFLLNSLLAKWGSKQNKFLPKIVIWTGILLVFLALVTATQIWLIFI